MKNQFILLTAIVSSFGTSTVVLGDECSSVDLRAPGHAMENVAITNQEDLGVCWAHSATSAMEAKLKSQSKVSKQFQVSQLDAYLNYGGRQVTAPSSPIKDQVEQNGDFCLMVEQLKAEGVCSQEQVDKKFNIFRQYDITNSKLMKGIDELGRNLEAWKAEKSSHWNSIIQNKLNLQTELQGYFEDRIFHHLEQLENKDPGLAGLGVEFHLAASNLKKYKNSLGQNSKIRTSSQNQLNAVIAQIKNHPLGAQYLYWNEMALENEEATEAQKFDRLSHLIYKDLLKGDFEHPKVKDTCKRISNYFPAIEELSLDALAITSQIYPIEMLKTLSKGLCKTRYRIDDAPNAKCIEIEDKNRIMDLLNKNFLLGKDASPVGLTFDVRNLLERPLRTGEVDTHHSSLIIGRKKIKNSCYYLIRNSWGESCDGIKSSKVICENGELLISEDDLMKHIISLQFPFGTKD
ncbi:MAG: C1 family peptidase [Bdellovibrionia bacterium]